MSWTPTELQRLQEVYRSASGGLVDIRSLAVELGKNRNTVRGAAFRLGLTDRHRPRIVRRPQAECPSCGSTFQPESRGHGSWTETCSMSCGRKAALLKHGHPRGATGMKHSPESLAKMSVAAKRMWQEMPEHEKARRAEIMRQSSSTRVRAPGSTYTRSKGGRRSDLNDQYFRSAWEANYARWLNFRTHHGDVLRWEYEPQTFRFPVQRGTMSYTPDFRVTFSDGRSEWHEVKGWLTQQGATALKRFTKYYPVEVLVLIGTDEYRAIAKQAKSMVEGWE